ncbi:hypothetical protein B484DRAFT_75202 [Ochromonadaceae sp. CCMP2298]|nr:hypothetical protein B484DRAFT_75202 [Ochromonadaceae sp. CCMP2298]
MWPIHMVCSAIATWRRSSGPTGTAAICTRCTVCLRRSPERCRGTTLRLPRHRSRGGDRRALLVRPLRPLCPLCVVIPV